MSDSASSLPTHALAAHRFPILRALQVAAALVLGVLWAPPLHAQPKSSADAFLSRAVDEVMAVAYAQGASAPLAERIRPVLERFFAFDTLTRRAIGPGWRDFTADQQQTARELFTSLVIRTYSERFDPLSRPEIRFASSTDLDRGRKEIGSSVIYAGRSYSVLYRLEPAADSWRVYDVSIEGVSLVANYRAQFEALQNRGGPLAVIESMRTSLTSKPKS
jgi:phospholipid transport system substrate-binding protein